ncbi:hypothetical protein PVL29_018126 [Vitis rotundifolia]|uniref:glutathione synthase n=1 Tax=Vitis rotundifolia TaxID=103349 RepID=A0AA39DFJ9_VITRO|nr:hypothetical protein PVL29_018126 [Vitis rotundifolia]
MLDWLASLYDMHAIILYLCPNLVSYNSAQLVTKVRLVPNSVSFAIEWKHIEPKCGTCLDHILIYDEILYRLHLAREWCHNIFSIQLQLRANFEILQFCNTAILVSILRKYQTIIPPKSSRPSPHPRGYTLHFFFIYKKAIFPTTPQPHPQLLKIARLLMEQSSAVECPSISYHLAGTKKIQQELAKPNVLERKYSKHLHDMFLENNDDIAKLRKCFAGLWGLDDSNIIKDAIERPEFFVMKPQREGGGNNIYGDDVRETLLRLQKEGTEEDAAYILMQRIFPTVSPTFLMREGICHRDHAISELGIYGAYLRIKEKVIVNEQCGYLMRTKVSSSNEGGVAAGFAVLDSIYLT